MTERRACRLANQPRGTQRYRAIRREDEDALTQAIVQRASQYGRYGYRRITALLKRAGWRVGKDRVERIWRREGLKVPQKQKPRGRLWLHRKWLAKTGAKTLYIEPGSPWENGYCESFNSKLRDEFLNGEIFYSMKELRVLAERWRVHYNTIRPHSSLGYRSPAPEGWLINSMGHGEVETATRFPLLHTPDGGYFNSEEAALN
jgi:transposase InsO family protein